jgi:hypothetical protein
MKSDKMFDDPPVKTSIPIRLTAGGPRRNPVISLSGAGLQRQKVNKEVLPSKRIGLLQLAIRNGISQSSRIMAWDNQRLFGPCPADRSPVEKNDLEGE